MHPALATAQLYGTAGARVLARSRRWSDPRPRRRDDRLVFVVGSPRSGTTFLGQTLGRQPGLLDLDEVQPLKAAIPSLVGLPDDDAAKRLRRTLELVRRLGLATHLRGVEQTPETAFVLPAALLAYPQARAVHMLRDGRDVVCSLLERGWLRADRSGGDDARLPYGARARFWVEPDRREEFGSASEATRAAWAWRTHVTAARAASAPRTLELRYETLVGEPDRAAAALAEHLGAPVQAIRAALGESHDRSVGRFRRDLSPEQVDDVEREAGPLLRELGYAG